MSPKEHEAGRELDARVAVEVMGWRRSEYSAGGERVMGLFHDALSFAYCAEFGPPRYSTDISAAWEVVEKLRAGGSFWIDGLGCAEQGGEWRAIIGWQDGDRPVTVVHANTAPLAICLVALRALTRPTNANEATPAPDQRVGTTDGRMSETRDDT